MSLLLHPKLLPQEGTPRRAAPPAHAAPSPFLVPVRLRRVIPTRVSAPPRARSRSAPFPPSPSHQLGVHVRYDGSPESFDAHHPDLVAALDPDRLADVHADLAAELARRRDHFSRAERRRREVAARYRPLHPDVYVLLERHVDSRWRQLADMAREALAAAESASAKKPSARDVLLARATAAGVLRQRPRGVFAFPALSLEFCRALREEVAHFEQSGFEPSRPNTMNTNGLLLYELGAYPRLLDPLVARLVAPVAAALFGGDATTSPGAASLDHHRSFTVSYEVGKEVDLAYHHDDSEVTLNVCLGATWPSYSSAGYETRRNDISRGRPSRIDRGWRCYTGGRTVTRRSRWRAARGRISSCGVAVPRRGGGARQWRRAKRNAAEAGRERA